MTTGPFPAFAAAAAFVALTLPAAAGDRCADCYRRVIEPPVYGVSAEPVLLRAPRTGGYVIPAEYATITERVEIEPARRVWQVSRDSWGQEIGCWVTIPGRSELRHRRVVTRPAEVVPVAINSVYGLRQTRVLVSPAHPGWEPVGPRSDFVVESVVGSAY